jgi:hypothetical protein
MKKSLISIGIILVLLFIAGGFTAVFQGLDVLWQVFIGFLPIFKPIIEQSLSDYFTSAYFIVGVIIFIGKKSFIYNHLYNSKCHIIDKHN